MKRFLCLGMLIVLFITMIPINAFAAQESVNNDEVIYFDDGSYVAISLSDTGSRATASKSGSKTYTYYSSSGVAQWKAVLSGTFTYTGTSSTCTASSCSVTIYKTDWYTVSKSASKSGNTATAAVTMGRKSLGITVDKKSINISLSCDINGTLS